MPNWNETVMGEEELCKVLGCAIGNKVVDKPCPFEDKRTCSLLASAKFTAQSQAEITWKAREPEIAEAHKAGRKEAINQRDFAERVSDLLADWQSKLKE